MANMEDVKTWKWDGVHKFLTYFGVPSICVDIFFKEEVDGEALIGLDKKEFRDIYEVPHGIVVKLWKCLHGQTSSVDSITVEGAANPGTVLTSDTSKIEEAQKTETSVNPNSIQSLSSLSLLDQSENDDSKGSIGSSPLLQDTPGGAIPKKKTLPKANHTQCCADFLSKHLHTINFEVLDNADPHVKAMPCTLRHYFVKSQENVLQKQLGFLILTKEEVKKPHVVWNAICKDQKTWLSMLPKERQEEYVIDEDGILSMREKRYVCLSDGIFAQTSISKPVQSCMNDCIYILIVEDTLVQEETLVYITVEKNQKRYVQFSVGKGQFDACFGVCHLSNPKFKLKIAATNKRLRKALGTGEGHLYMLPENEKNILTNTADTTSMQSYDSDESLSLPGEIVDANLPELDRTVPDGTIVEQPRSFERQSGGFSYSLSSQLASIETGRKDLMQPAHEFKLLKVNDQSDIKLMLEFFISQTLRFSCGCLNKRTNGTIHFGIADGNAEEAKKYGCFSREIVGVPIAGETQDKFNDKLREFIGKSFNEPNFARECIRPVVFVPIARQQNLFVIEVDVVSTGVFTKDILFEVSLPGEKKPKPAAYVREGSSTCKIEGKEKYEMLVKTLPRLDKERCRLEVLEMRDAKSSSIDQASLHKTLEHLICFDKKEMDESVFPILVLSSSMGPQRETLNAESLQFIKTTDWKVVIDFDDEEFVKNCVFGEGQTSSYRFLCAEDFQDDAAVTNLLDQPPCWIWGNGSKHEDTKSSDYYEWYSSERNRGLSKVIQHLSEELPIRKVVVLFLLFSDSYRELIAIFSEFCKQFEGSNQLVYVAPGDNATHFQSGLARFLPEDQVLGRGVVGMPWSDFNRSMQQFCKVVRDKGLVLPSPYGANIETRREIFNQDLIFPLGTKDCDELGKLPAHERQELALKEQLKFYGGAPVTWKNFWYNDKSFNHVRERVQTGVVLEKVSALLQKPPIEGRVFTFQLQHEPGSGASTLSRHVLWKLSHTKPYKCRCCVVKKITDQTVSQLLWFRRYMCENNENVLPIVALVDDLDSSLFKSFLYDMTNKAQDLPRSKCSVIAFLQTKECISLPQQVPEGGSATLLRQHLDEEDIEWFENKYVEMSNNHIVSDGYAIDNLIGFMMMKENFNPEYGNSVAKRSFENATEPHEKNLLKYLSLLCSYSPYPVFTSAFDSMMVTQRFWKRKFLTDWFPNLTPSTSILLKQKDLSEHYGTGPGVAIVHPNIAKHILEIAGSSVGDLSLEFLATAVFQIDHSPHVKHLKQLTQDMLKQRKKSDHGEDKQTKFSPLIEKIVSEPNPSSVSSMSMACKEGVEKAETLLVKGLELFADPVIAQQLARLLSLNAELYDDRGEETNGDGFERCFQRALAYADEAIKMQPNNSFFIDTKGRIYRIKYHLMFDYIQKASPNRSISIGEVVPAIELSLEAIEWFKKSQHANRQNRNLQENLYGYVGELTTMQSLLNLFTCMPAFSSPEGLDELRRYLREETFIPDAVKTTKLARFHVPVKKFLGRYCDCMAYIREDRTVFKDFHFSSEQIKYKDHERFFKFFSSGNADLCVIESDDFSDEEKFHRHWQKINNYLMGELFSNVFNIDHILTKFSDTQVRDARTCLQKFQIILEWNLQHCLNSKQGRLKTILGMITVSMALHSPHGPKHSVFNREGPPSKRVKEEYNTVYQLVQEYVRIESKTDSLCLYSYLFQVMFLWPRKDNEITEYTSEGYEKSLQVLRDKFYSQRRNRSGGSGSDVKQNLNQKFTFTERPRPSTTLYYLGHGSGLDVFVHINELQSLGKSSKWGTRLRRLTGRRDSSTSIKMNNPFRKGESLLVRYVDTLHRSFSREDLSFFLGFSWYGPVAFDVKSKEEDASSTFSQSLHPSPETLQLASYGDEHN